ncbi:MAG: hydroxymethylbilane synthase, partial [Syntrophales bacterium]|nr:hydroxymethylbilane synthase [Syntrophales bacterium]
ELTYGLDIAAIPLREDPRDVLISKRNRRLEEMSGGARIGTGSLRRGVQLLNRRSDLEIVPLRGNLDTRIRKLEAEGLDGVIVAAAGLRRMGWAGRISQFLPMEMMLPAVGQGAIGIEIRRDDARCREAVEFLSDPETSVEVGAERAFLKRLGGGCQLPIAGFAKTSGHEMVVEGLVGSLDGRIVIRRQVRGPAEAFAELGEDLAERVLAEGGRELLDALNKPA